METVNLKFCKNTLSVDCFYNISSQQMIVPSLGELLNANQDEIQEDKQEIYQIWKMIICLLQFNLGCG